MNSLLTYDVLIERIRNFCENRDDIRLSMIIGSRARTDRPADSLSDLDLVLFTTEPQLYISSDAWLEELGHSYLTFVEQTAVGEFVERRVLFEDGLDVDFIPLPVHVIEGDLPLEIGLVLQRGYRVVVDKDAYSEKLQVVANAKRGGVQHAFHKPSQQAFSHLVNDFLYHAVWSAKKLCRGELWMAKMCSDGYMKRQLLNAIEWYHHAKAPESLDTWHEGRFLDSWADEDVLSELRDAFAHYEVDSVWPALNASVRLFGRLCREAGMKWGYSYPATNHNYVLQLLEVYQQRTKVEDQV